MEDRNFLARLIDSFLRGNMALLLLIISLAIGVTVLFVTPREEEPQIVVPLADVMVSYPGGSAAEVEKLVSSRLERILSQIDGVEYVYSMARPGMAVVTVRFYVGEDREKSLIKLYNKIFQNIDKTTPGIAGWIIKPIEIDDVPIINATLYSASQDTHALRRIAEEAVAKLQHVESTAAINIYGGERRVVHVTLNTERMAAYGLSVMELAGALKAANAQAESGTFSRNNAEVSVTTGPFLETVEEVRNLMVGLHDNRPVYLRDVAEVRDGPDEAASYTRLGVGPAGSGPGAGRSYPAVTIAVAKQKGSNAVRVSREVSRTLNELKGSVIPDDVQVRITRDNGETANEKVNDLVENLALAIITVIGLIAISMSWREGLIVALAVPITYSLTLLINYLAGYTINRVTLFALILALGLLVDDPTVAVENISRHLGLKKQKRLDAILAAMKEILSPLVVATLAVMVCFLPMFFITGMMGPYMRPMALNMPIAMLMSMIVSVAITPWLCSKLLKDTGHAESEPHNVSGTILYRLYRRVVLPLIVSPRKAWLLLGGVGLLLLGSMGLALTGLVPLKILPFDNKNELQLVVDMPESATLETTDSVVRELESFLNTVPEVTAFVSTVGISSPLDFNGLVRHYYLRQGPNIADVRVNLAHRKQRVMDSHSIALRIRKDIEAIGARTGANIKLVELPPGPPVLSTLVAEIYGKPWHTYDDLIAAAQVVEDRMRREPGVVDVDDLVESDQRKLFFRVDREKAGLNGIATEDVARTLQMAMSGYPAGSVHVMSEQNELPILLRLPRAQRSAEEQLKLTIVKGRGGQTVQLGELGRFEEAVTDKTIFHKNQERVVFVTGETAGRGPAYPVLELTSYFEKHPLPKGLRVDWSGEGEWKITLDVFRDLGLAYAAALLLIYILLVWQTNSYALPGVIMLAIPLTLIGIMPGFWMLNLLTNRPVGGFDNPVFFTATAMIGMIALGGIVVRNSIILIDFIAHTRKQGVALQEAVITAGAVRFRPIFLTAGAAILGAWPITLDPIFSGLAWALIFGLFVSTAFTLVVIPLVYVMLYGDDSGEADVRV